MDAQLTEIGIRNWLARHAQDIAPDLPELTDSRVCIGNYSPANCVSVSGFHNKTRRHLHFSGATVAEAAKAARAALDKISPA